MASFYEDFSRETQASGPSERSFGSFRAPAWSGR